MAALSRYYRSKIYIEFWMNNNINEEVDIYHGDHFKLIPSNKSLYVIYCQIHVQAQVCITAPGKMNSIILRC